MIHPAPTLSVQVDARNPGQFFACCGLFELAHRLWPRAEAWFDVKCRRFFVIAEDAEPTLGQVVENLRRCEISGLTEEERRERDALEEEKRDLSKKNPPAILAPEKESRRKELGKRARAGTLRLADPVALLLDWWQSEDDTGQTPKTWAGLQEIHKIARSAQQALSGIDDLPTLLDHGCVLRTPAEYCKQGTDGQKAVEPFYFDARRFAHALDAGFSLDALEAETIAHPAVELLGLIGLQRFRPCPTPVRRSFDYWVWSRPLSAPVAAGVACGSVPASGRSGYRFALRFRDDQKRYKAFGWATTIGDDT
jgi:CRISPR-associated protein Csb3